MDIILKDETFDMVNVGKIQFHRPTLNIKLLVSIDYYEYRFECNILSQLKQYS